MGGVGSGIKGHRTPKKTTAAYKKKQSYIKKHPGAVARYGTKAQKAAYRAKELARRQARAIRKATKSAKLGRYSFFPHQWSNPAPGK